MKTILRTLKYYITIPKKGFRNCPAISFHHSGSYWAMGSDPRQLSAYDPANIYSDFRHITLFLENHREKASPYLYSGAMARTNPTFDLSHELEFTFRINIPSKKHVKTALWFKSITDDINEVDIFECFNFKTYGSFVKVIFTNHHGLSYETDHQMDTYSLFLKPFFKVTLTTGEYFTWYINDRKIFRSKNTITDKVALIADIEASGIAPLFSSEYAEFTYGA